MGQSKERRKILITDREHRTEHGIPCGYSEDAPRIERSQRQTPDQDIAQRMVMKRWEH